MRTNKTTYRSWAGLLLKRQLKSPSTWLMLGLSLFLLWVLQSLIFSGSDNLHFGVTDGGTVYAEEILQSLRENASPYELVVCDSEESLKQQVSSGVLDCGFVLTEALDHITGVDDLQGTVGYYGTTSTQKGLILQEKVSASVFQTAAAVMLRTSGEDPELFETPGAEVGDALVASYRELLESDAIFRVNFETVESEKKGIADGMVTASDRLMALCSLLLFFGALLHGRLRFEGECRNIAQSMRGRDRRVWNYLSLYTPVFLLSLGMAGAWGAVHRLGKIPAKPELLALGALLLLLMGPIAALWTYLYSGLFKKAHTYLVSLLGILMLGILSNSALLPIASLLPGLRPLRWLYPTQWVTVALQHFAAL